MSQKVIVGMSGGVDSSTTAYLLKQKGYQVEGISFILYEARSAGSESYRQGTCCSIEAIKEAAIVAGQLGIPHTVIDLREEFLEKVITPFIEAYRMGLTPNPCILCNKYIKFPWLVKSANERDAQFISTGHYAKASGGRLCKGVDIKKDQSYFLYVLDKDILKALLLPLGEKTKQEVREIAKSLGLVALRRPESQEICFIQDKRYIRFLEGMIEPEEGPVIDIRTGEVLKRHKGIFHYTIGQRKGLGISSKEPLYVVRIDASQRAVYVGRREDTFKQEIYVKDLNWLEPELILTPSIESRQIRATVKIRSTMRDEPATLYLQDGVVRVVFDIPQFAPAPGQSAVFYQNDLVLGGGVISLANS